MPTKVTTSYLGGAFQSVRWVFHGYSPYQMQQIGTGTLERGILPRIRQAQDIYDSPAQDLNPQYAKLKASKGKKPIRDWDLTGRLMRSTRVVASQENQATLGATDNVINARLFYNNRRRRQFGVSPKDQIVLLQEFGKQAPHMRAEVQR